MRLIACAGALATGLLLGGAGAGIAIADDESTSAGAEGGAPAAAANVEAEPDDDSGGAESNPDSDGPTSTVGNGRQDIGREPAAEEEKKPDPVVGQRPKFKHSLSIPVLRLPTPEELAATGPYAFFGTVDVPVPSIDGFLSTLSQPEPEPTPGPAFRTQEVPEAPVIDVTGGGGSGGLDPMAAGNNGAPVFELPLVMAPAIPIPGVRAPTVPVGASAAGGPPMAVSAPTPVAGARTPLIRGSLSPRAETAKTVA